MNSASTYKTSTTDSAQTRRLGEAIGRLLSGGMMVELVGDMGSGKTTLTQGIAAGMGVAGDVTSPTFTVSRVYPGANGLSLHHFDFYRLSGLDITTTELDEATRDPQAATVVEWAGHGAAKLPASRLSISLTPGQQESQRDIEVRGYGAPAQHIVERLRDDYRH